MRIGIFGGSFDPVHLGHLILAERCLEQCGLDTVMFLPTAVPPHKQKRNLTKPHHRVQMLRLAVAGHVALDVSTWETDRGGVNFTAETLAEFQQQHPDSQLFFLMGADSLNDLPNWREPARILELAIPAVVRRAGKTEPDFNLLNSYVDKNRLDQIRQAQVEMPLIELSSTNIRQRVCKNQTIRYLTPRAVEEYIREHQLYHETA